MEKSNQISDTSIGRGQTIKRAFPMDNIKDCKLSETKGGKFGGSQENLSHSLSGASAVDAGSVK